jgi:hypothetical protein
MAFLIALLTLVLAALVVLVVGAPLRRGRQPGQDDLGASVAPGDELSASAASIGRIEALESAREAKYREIRDAELDFRTGKLSRDDYDAIDSDLRAEALEILNQLGPVDDEPTEERSSGPGALEQQERVQEEQHSKEDRPPV